MTFREFTGKNVEEAIRTAMKEYSAELAELDIEILSQGSRGILGVGGEEARILAAPKSAVAAAETVRDTAPEPEPMAPVREASGPAAQAADEGEPISEQVADLARSDAPPRRDAGGRSDWLHRTIDDPAVADPRLAAVVHQRRPRADPNVDAAAIRPRLGCGQP